MRIWIDTEFNEFKGELISMALVAEDGRKFYESLGCEKPGPWVAQHVMPFICIAPIQLTFLQALLQDFLSRYETVHLVADWPEDIAHFCNVLITGPGMRLNTPTLTMEIRRDLDAISEIPHNALADAIAMRDAYLAIEATSA